LSFTHNSVKVAPKDTNLAVTDPSGEEIVVKSNGYLMFRMFIWSYDRRCTQGVAAFPNGTAALRTIKALNSMVLKGATKLQIVPGRLHVSTSKKDQEKENTNY
jgi:hypothetical protein